MASGLSGAPHELELRVLHQSATRLLRNVEKAHCNALAAVGAARAQDEEQEVALKRVRHDPEFTAFARKLGLDEDLRIALHIWTASSCANKSLDLHLDSLDVPFLLNAIAAIGVDRSGTVVRLRGAYLMVVLQWSEEPLHKLVIKYETPARMSPRNYEDNQEFSSPQFARTYLIATSGTREQRLSPGTVTCTPRVCSGSTNDTGFSRDEFLQHVEAAGAGDTASASTPACRHYRGTSVRQCSTGPGHATDDPGQGGGRPHAGRRGQP